MNDYITCAELIDFIAEYREGTLASADVHELERHLAVCPSCVDYLASYDRTVALLGIVRSEAPAPEGVPAPLVAAILAARRREV